MNEDDIIFLISIFIVCVLTIAITIQICLSMG